MCREIRVPEVPPDVVAHRPSHLAKQVRVLCGGPPDFLVQRWWTAKPGISVKPRHVIVRACTPPAAGIEGSVSFTPDHDSDAARLTLDWEGFFAAYEPSADIGREAPFNHDPILRERSNYETATRADVCLHADRTMARLHHATSVAREADPATRVNS